MALPVVTVASGGIAVTDVSGTGKGLPVTEATRGTAVTKVAAGGMPVAYVNADGSSGIPQYLGQVATRSNLVPYSYNSGNTNQMSRSVHFARESVTSIQVVYVNAYVDTNNNTNTWQELGTGTTATIKVGFETAGGAFSQFKFSGVVAGLVATKAIIISDPLAVNLAPGDKFFIRTSWVNTGGIINYPQNGDATLGDRLEFTATDKTISGTVANNVPGYVQFPSAIIGQTTKRSAALIGTSRCHGFNDTADGITGDIGTLARGLGPLCAYSNGGVPGDSLQRLVASMALRVQLANTYFSDTYIEHGINDNSRTLVQKQGDLATLMAAITNRKRLVTASPNTVGAWTAADGSDQTNNRADLTPWNAYVLTKPNGAYACYDIAADHTGQPGKWKAPGWTTDGLHGSSTAYIFTKTNGTLTI
jgi:hypothetical protein